MKPRWKGRAVLQRWIVFCLLYFAIAVVAKDDEPTITRNSFDHRLTDVLFFDDSETVLATDRESAESWRSTDSGVKWKKVVSLSGTAVKLILNPSDNKVAVALSATGRHWITKDQGETWKNFKMEAEPDFMASPVSFHSSDNNKIIINTASTVEKTYYTDDGFETNPKRFKAKTIKCIWAKEQLLFNERTKDKHVDDSRVLCVVQGKYSTTQDEFKLVITDNFFESATEPEMENGRTVSGIVNMVAVKGFICAARMSQASHEMALYTTVDSNEWRRARFGHEELKSGGFTIMESTNYSLQVDVAVGGRPNDVGPQPMGRLYTSNSAGFKFTPIENYTNRNQYGFADFEKLQNIQGIVLVNQVDNHEEVLKGLEEKKLVSRISFDDGRSFHPLKSDKDDHLHLHSITDQSNVGRVFSSPAPGIVMGVGNTGSNLLNYRDGNTCVSDDAGLTWTCPLKGPHKYEFGDQGSVLLAVPDEEETTKISYSFDHGKEWKSATFEKEIRPILLTTTPDSTSLKFLMLASEGKGFDMKYALYSIDFTEVDVRKCEDKDFEKWYVRQDDDGKPGCIMGHKQSFRRRKPDSICFVKSKFREPQPDQSEQCTCTKADYECDEGFVRSDEYDVCLPNDPVKPPPGKCESEDDKDYMGPSGYRVIPGNDCDRKDGPKLAMPKKWDCKDAKKATGEISTKITSFPASTFKEYFYMENPTREDGDSETIVALTDRRAAYISYNHGKEWKKIFEDEEILAIYPNRFEDSKDVYFITPTKKVYYTKDRGKNFDHFEAPGLPNTVGLLALRFHQKEPDWLIWTTCDENAVGCEPVAYASFKRGHEWERLTNLVENCEFVWEKTHRSEINEKRILCIQHESRDRDSKKQLLASDDLFVKKKVIFDDVLNFATMSEYIIVAAKDGKDSKFLKVDASIDAEVFADAKFPANFEVIHQTAYTVLDSSTHAIFLHVTTSSHSGSEYGSIIKSNSNGTSYVMSIGAVNRNSYGYVDFEKMFGMEGVAIVNVVSNAAEVNETRAMKKLKTMITFSDGAYWDILKAPERDSEGEKYSCKAKCSLHLHGYTERKDPRDTFSSESAVGLMMGIGNVGEYLGGRDDGDTFLSNDGGITWKSVKKGQYMWEYGDQGSIIVIVQEKVPTRVVYYSRDEGETWTEHRFSSHDLLIDDITTVPTDTSRNFLLWGKDGEKAVAINLDFTDLTDQKCVLDLDKPNDPKKDYKLWIPKHPNLKDNCLFGHVTEFLRKKPLRDCYNGLPRLEQPYKIKKNCSCTVQDFECDYNYERNKDGKCKLIKDLKPKNHKDVCKNPKVTEWYEPTGYRKIPLSTCEGGKELELTAPSHPCPGHEKEYRDKHGISGVGLFFAIVLPIAAAGGIGWWIYRHYEGRFGLGRIRLETGGNLSEGSSFSGANLLKWPVAIISGAAAVAMAVPMVIGSVYRSVRERLGYGSWHSQRARYGYGSGTSPRPYTSRSSFARGRGGYAPVGATDESDLLGDDDSD